MSHFTSKRDSLATVHGLEASVAGDFSPREAGEISDGLLRAAGNVQRVRDMSSRVHFECCDDVAWNRLEDLESSRSELAGLLAEARRAGKSVRLTARIEVELVDGEQNG